MSENVIRTTCGYCSTGCNLSVESSADGTLKVTANPAYPVNLGKACPKGFQFLGHLAAADRAMMPLFRRSDGKFKETGWDNALKIFSGKFRRIQQLYGREALAFLNTGQITNEEFAFLGALAKFGMGIIHGDGNTRQCMTTTAVAYKQSFGFDAPPFTYRDFEESDVMLFFGSNPVVAHPVMWNRVKMNKRQPKIMVFDPRKSETARIPGVEHYALRPKSDIILLYGLANIFINRGWISRDFIESHTYGFDGFRSHVSKFTIDMVVEETGLSDEQVNRVAGVVHGGERVSFWWMVGLNQGFQAVRTVQAIVNLALLTGSIGRPGTGANSITGQRNAMGSRLFGNTTGLFCGRDFTKPEHRREVAKILNIGEDRIPEVDSFSYDKILEGVDAGRIKGLWIVCTNPAHSWVDRNHFFNVMKKAEFIVVQDMFYSTETARLADLVLPAAGCGEKNGTFINSERRIALVQRVSAAPGEALPDFEIFRRVARAWGCEGMFREWSSPEAVFHILKRLSRGTPCDFSGIADYEELDISSGIQWPFPGGSGPGEKERRLFANGVFFHHDGKARFLFEDIKEPEEKPDAQYPFILITGRGSVSSGTP